MLCKLSQTLGRKRAQQGEEIEQLGSNYHRDGRNTLCLTLA
jgi:hypothetical protein